MPSAAIPDPGPLRRRQANEKSLAKEEFVKQRVSPLRLSPSASKGSPLPVTNLAHSQNRRWRLFALETQQTA